MSKKKLIDDTINYLKFYKDYNNYQIFTEELKKLPEVQAVKFQKDIVKTAEFKITEKVHISPEVKIPEEVKEVKRSEYINEDWKSSTTLEEFEDRIKNCSKCKLLADTRKQIVFGAGNPKAEIVVVGEAPGADEDEQGKPFVGKAGKLLTDILKAINFTREEVYICNILKCRPPENRNPVPEEITK